MNVVHLVVLLVPIAILALFIWALVTIIQANFRESNEKIVWILVVLFIPLIGSILWLAWGRRSRAIS